jgi:hypothetical protein
VETVIVEGRVVMEERRVTTLDTEEVTSAARQWAGRIRAEDGSPSEESL